MLAIHYYIGGTEAGAWHTIPRGYRDLDESDEELRASILLQGYHAEFGRSGNQPQGAPRTWDPECSCPCCRQAERAVQS